MQQRLVDLMVNPDMLAVNQEWAGFAGDRVWSEATGKECWAKPLPGAAVGVGSAGLEELRGIGYIDVFTEEEGER